MPGGFIHVKNNANFLYLAIDLTNDTGNTPGVGDYFWLSFDVDRSGSITPHFDVNYGIYPSLPIKIAKQYYLSPGTWTGILGGFTPSAVQQGFAASPHSATPHRIWEMRIALLELGVVALGTSTLPYVRFGLRVASTTPSFVTIFRRRSSPVSHRCTLFTLRPGLTQSTRPGQRGRSLAAWG
jgi:hypothetical protein